MNELYWIVIILVPLWAIILLLDWLYDLESRGAEIAPGVLMWRTGWGIDLLDRIAKVSKRTWKFFGIIGAILGTYLMWRTFYTITDYAFSLLQSLWTTGMGGAGGQSGGVMPIIPGLTTPLISGLLAIATVVIVHEMSHGILARRANLEVKSTGFGLLAFLPLAFVEPDEEKLESASLSDRLQIFSAGSFSNIILSLVTFGLVLALVVPLPGLYVYYVGENTPAENVLRPGMKLSGIGYQSGYTHEVEQYGDLDNFLDGTRPGDRIVIETDNGVFDLVLENDPYDNEGYIGISSVWSVSRGKIFKESISSLFVFWKPPAFLGGGINQYSYDYRVPQYVLITLIWIFIFNLGVGLFNLLPLLPLDGGRILSALLGQVISSTKAKFITWGVSGFTLSMILINLIPWLARIW